MDSINVLFMKFLSEIITQILSKSKICIFKKKLDQIFLANKKF